MGEGLYEDADGHSLLPDSRTSEQLKRGEWGIQPPHGHRGPLRQMASDEKVSNPQNPYGLSKISQESIATDEFDPLIKIGWLLIASVNRFLEAVENPNVIAPGEQPIGRVRADEPRSAGYQNFH